MSRFVREYAPHLSDFLLERGERSVVAGQDEDLMVAVVDGSETCVRERVSADLYRPYY
jgi:hypothetical protein